MSTTTASLTVRKILPCPPERAFQAWTTPELFRQWFAPDPAMTTTAEVDLRLGGKYRIGFHPPGSQSALYVGGEFVVIEAPHNLEYTWVWEKESNPDWKDQSVVKVKFNRLDADRTEIVLTHEKISDPERLASHNQGWIRIIDRMAVALA